jgi:hypothetical protein
VAQGGNEPDTTRLEVSDSPLAESHRGCADKGARSGGPRRSAPIVRGLLKSSISQNVTGED